MIMSDTNSTATPDTATTTASNGETAQTELPTKGHLQKMGMLDLRAAKTAEDLKGITGISQVGCVLVPEHLATVLAQIPMTEVGSIVPVPEGENIKTQVGQIRLSGEALAGGNPDHILFIVGQVFITTPVTSVGYKEIWIHGQLFAIRGSEGTLGAKLTRMHGQTFYMPSEARVFMGEENIGREFLDLLPEPKAFVIMGSVTFEDDVTVELLKAKVLEIVLMGQINAPAALVPLLQVLTVEKMGQIVAKA